MVPLFFSHIWQFYPCAVPTSLLRYTNFFLIFDCSIITLGNTNITYDCTFVTFNGSLFLLTFDSSIVTLSRTNITYGRCQPNPTPPNYLIINEYGYVWIHVLAPRLRLRLAYYWDPHSKTWKRELDLAKRNSCAKLETQIFLKQCTVSLIHQVLFMDSSCAKQAASFSSDTQRFIKLKLGLAHLVHPCASCVNKTTQLFWSTSKRCTASTAIFTKLRYLLLPLSTTLFNAFNAGWCSVRIVFNALHLPTNHKTIKTEKERNSETHYAFLSAVDLLQRTSSPLWTPLPPLWTPLPPLWVSAFTGKTQITSHALWIVGVVILFSIGFSSICGFLWSVLCSMFLPFFFFCVFHDTIKVGFLILNVNLCCIWIYVWV